MLTWRAFEERVCDGEVHVALVDVGRDDGVGGHQATVSLAPSELGLLKWHSMRISDITQSSTLLLPR